MEVQWDPFFRDVAPVLLLTQHLTPKATFLTSSRCGKKAPRAILKKLALSTTGAVLHKWESRIFGERTASTQKSRQAHHHGPKVD